MRTNGDESVCMRGGGGAGGLGEETDTHTHTRTRTDTHTQTDTHKHTHTYIYIYTCLGAHVGVRTAVQKAPARLQQRARHVDVVVRERPQKKLASE